MPRDLLAERRARQGPHATGNVSPTIAQPGIDSAAQSPVSDQLNQAPTQPAPGPTIPPISAQQPGRDLLAERRQANTLPALQQQAEQARVAQAVPSARIAEQNAQQAALEAARRRVSGVQAPSDVLGQIKAQQAPVIEQATQAAVAGTPTQAVMDPARQLDPHLNAVVGRDTAVNQSGVQDAGFRAGLSKMDTPEERFAFLERTAGPGGSSVDSQGNLTLTPQGLANLGIRPGNLQDVRIDEPGLTRFDVADFRGEAPSIIGGTAAGLASSGLGLIPAALMTGLGTAGGKGFGEAAEALAGENLQSPGEVAGDLAIEAGAGALGEGLFRGIAAPAGRKVLAPGANKVSPEQADIMQSALDIGGRPTAASVGDRPVAQRFQTMANTIMGDPLEPQNRAAMGARADELRASVPGTARELGDLGELIKTDIKAARKELSDAAQDWYGEVDRLVGDAPIVPTARLKDAARQVLAEMPESAASGKPVFTDEGIVKTLREVEQLGDTVSVGHMQAIRTRLREVRGDPGLLPGLADHDARILFDAADGSFDDVVITKATPNAVQAKNALRVADQQYREGIQKFNIAMVKRMTKDPSLAGSLPPELVAQTLMSRGMHTHIRQVQKVVSPETFDSIRGAAMDEFLGPLMKRSETPGQFDFDGKAFLNGLDKRGNATLDALFGAQKRKELVRFGEVVQLLTKKGGTSGGLVAAGVILRPIRNFRRIVQMVVLRGVFNHPKAVQWLTIGLKAPNTRRGGVALGRVGTLVASLAATHGALDKDADGVQNLPAEQDQADGNGQNGQQNSTLNNNGSALR